MKHLWFIFYHSELLLQQLEDGSYTIPLSEEPPVTINAHTVIHAITPMIDGTSVKTLMIDEFVTDKQKFEMCTLRQSYYKLTEALYTKAGKCYEINYWDKHTQYCGVCGAPMKLHTDISKRCTQCGHEVWPQLATAIIVLVHRGEEVLLVHANNFKGKFYGLVAGFVETGETLEEAVKREVKEETGLEITDLHYFGSQPWPYPCGLMIGFLATYKSGTVELQHEELGSGGWYHRKYLPEIPEKLSLARKLIDYWLDMFKDESSSSPSS